MQNLAYTFNSVVMNSPVPESGRDKVPNFDVVKGRRGGPDPGKILQQAFHHAHAVHGARLNVLEINKHSEKQR